VIADNLKTALLSHLPGIEVLSLVPERAPESGPSNGRFLVTARFPEGRPPRGPTTLRLNGWGCSFSWSGMDSAAKPGSKDWNHWGMIHDLRSEARDRSAKRKERQNAKKNGSQPAPAKPGAKADAKAGAKAGGASSTAPFSPSHPPTIDDVAAAAAKAKVAAGRALAAADKADSELKLLGQPLIGEPDYEPVEASARTVKLASSAAAFANDAAGEASAAATALHQAVSGDHTDGSAARDAAKSSIEAASGAAEE